MPRAKLTAAARVPEVEAAHVAPKASGKFVTVASKLPIHLELQLCGKKTSRVTGQFGSTTEDIFIKEGPRYLIRGTGHPEGTLPKGFPKAPNVNEHGFALTQGVPETFWRDWLEQNKDTEMVRNGMIMAHAEEASVADMTAEFAGADSGLGPINPDGDPRSPKPMNALIADITVAALD